MGLLGASSRLQWMVSSDSSHLPRNYKVSSIIVILLAFITLVVMLAATIYNIVNTSQLGGSPDSFNSKYKDDVEDVQKALSYLSIASVVLTTLTLAALLWKYSAASKMAKKCLQSPPAALERFDIQEPIPWNKELFNESQ
uniref:Uncharacterized protein n=1 Tax=Venturia canescens TaxID=32260 RepID=A0A0U1ZF68_9HYME|nr:hypothetical protein [Venturia canescens]